MIHQAHAAVAAAAGLKRFNIIEGYGWAIIRLHLSKALCLSGCAIIAAFGDDALAFSEKVR